MQDSKINRQEQEPLLTRYVPLFTWLPRYRREWLRFDILAGITVWGTTVPTAMGYAQIAGLPVQAGLYAAMVALVAYAFFGTSSLLKVETSPSMALMSAVVVAPLALGNITYYLSLSAALAVIVGLILIVAGLARMGFLADFLAKPVVIGFLFGLALIIIINQIPSLRGLESGSGNSWEQLWEIITSLDESNLLTLAVSGAAFFSLLLFRRYIPRFPGTLVVLGLSVLAVLALNLVEYGIAVVGPIPDGLPTLQLPLVRPTDLLSLFLGAMAMVFVALGESLGTASSFAAERHNRIDSDQELLALGVANLGAGLFQGFAVGANPATTSSTNASRSKTQLASIVTAALLLVTITTRVDWIGYLPQAVVAVAVILSVSYLLNLHLLGRLYRLRKIDFVLAVVSLIGVLTAGVLVGLLIAVFLSLLIVLYRSSRPHLAVLGKIPGHLAYGDIDENPDAEQIPGLLIVRPDVPLFFANASTLLKQVREIISRTEIPLNALILDMGASEDLDVASTDMLAFLVDELDDANIRFYIADAKSATRSRLEHTGLIDRIGEDRIYLRVPEAVEDFKVTL